MADKALNTLTLRTSSPQNSQDLLLFDETSNVGERINYTTLADAILSRMTVPEITVTNTKLSIVTGT